MKGVELPSLPWMWTSRRLASEARLLLSQVVHRVGRIEAPLPLVAVFMYMYRLTGGSISGLLQKRATANPFTRASCYSWSSKGNTSTTVHYKCFSPRLPKTTSTPIAGSAPSAEQCIDHQLPQHINQNTWHLINMTRHAMHLRTARVGGWPPSVNAKRKRWPAAHMRSLRIVR